MRKTRKGNVVKVVKEHYLRDDIDDGIGTTLHRTAPQYIIPDTNVVLHQIDLLENPKIDNVIILQTVLEETKHLNLSVYNRLRTLTGNADKHFHVFSNEHHRETYVERQKDESANDRNDRAIRVAALWYMRRLSEGVPVYLLTNDKDNMRKAQLMDIQCYTIHQYVKERSQYSDLVDLLNYNDETAVNGGKSGDGVQKRKHLFEQHKVLSEVMAGIAKQRYYQGIIQVSRNNISEARVPLSSGMIENHTAILIHGLENVNRAVNGDLVAVELLPKDQWTSRSSQRTIGGQKADVNGQSNASVPNGNGNVKPCGKVIGIIKRNWRTYCGSIEEGSEIRDGIQQNVLFVPIDPKIPRIRIKSRQVKELITKRITVVIDTWSTDSRYPEGHYVGTIGDIGDVQTEHKVVMLEYDIPHYEFSENVLKCLPAADWKIPQEEMKKRVDLRHLDVMSVDPPNITDIDDALHARNLPNGNIEIGVHIADVSYFVKEGTALDDEAIKRGTSVYLVDKRINMLPQLLTENLCSLVEDVDHLAFSVVWEMTPDAKIVDTKYHKSIICSKAALSYQEAQALIDDKSQKSQRANDLRTMLRLSKIIKQRRLDRGALELASPAVKFHLETETLNPTDVETYQMRETNSMVEEFMLLANVSVAEKIYSAFPMTATLRRHPAPDPDLFEPLQKSLRTIGFDLNITTSRSLTDSLDRIQIPGMDYLNTLVRILTTRCMQQARYFPSGDLPKEEFVHYGLAAPIYTHFTSPIRRYADILVHRALSCALGVEALTDALVDQKLVKDITDNLNTRNRMAQYAGRASVDIYTNIYFKNKVVEEEAYIGRCRANAIVVHVPRYGFESVVYVAAEKDTEESSPFEFDENKEVLTFKRDPSLQLKVFDKVRVKIFVHTSKNYRSKMVMQVIDPPVFQYMPNADLNQTQIQDRKRKLDDNKTEEEEDNVHLPPSSPPSVNDDMAKTTTKTKTNKKRKKTTTTPK